MNKNSVVLFLLLIAFLIRVVSIDNSFYGDENPWPYAAVDHSNYGFNFDIQRSHDSFIWTSPPLAPLIYRFFTWFIGVNEVTMRLVPLIFSLINIALTYLLARKLFGEKTALYSIIIMAISFWHIIASFLIEHDGSILMFFWLLFFIMFVDFEKTQKYKYLVWCGIILGLSLLTKLTGGLILISLGVYLLFKHKSIKSPLIICSRIFLIGILLFSIFPILSLIFYPSYFQTILAHSSRMTLIPALFSVFRVLIYLLLWATPLLFGLALISFFKRDKYGLLWSWCLVVVLFAVFTNYVGAVDRYMSVMIPALCILGGNVLKNFDIKNWKLVAVLALFFFSLFFVLNFIPSVWIEHDVGNYIYRAFILNWDFVFQFHGGSGPGFMASFIPLGVGIVLSLLFFVWLVLSRFNKTILMIFVAIILSFNLFLVQAFIINHPYPDVGGTTYEIVNYVKENNLSKPFFVTDMNLGWYFNLTSDFYVIGDVYTDEVKEVEDIKAIIKERKGTLIITDYPKRLKIDVVWELSKECSLKKTFDSKNIALGHIFIC